MNRYLPFIIQFGLISKLELVFGNKELIGSTNVSSSQLTNDSKAYTEVQISMNDTTHMKEIATVLERPLKEKFGEYSVTIKENKLLYAFNSNNRITKYKIEQIIETSKLLGPITVFISCGECPKNMVCENLDVMSQCVPICDVKQVCPEGFKCELKNLEISCEKINATNSGFPILLASVGITTSSLVLIIWVYNKLELNDEEIKRQKLKRINKELSQIDVEHLEEARPSQVSFKDKITKEPRKSLTVINE